MLDNEKLLFDELYEKTKDCGRVQFVKLLMTKERENKELKEKLDKYENPEDMTLMMMWCTEKVKDENQELKKQLHEASLTIQEMTERDIECPSNCEKLRILKKQLEDKTEDYKRMKDNFDSKVDVITEIDTQQKEFIKYLEDEIQQQETVIAENQEKLYFFKYEDEKEDLKLSSQKAYIRRIILEEILQKYKSIIGG